MKDIKDYTLEELKGNLIKRDLPHFYAEQIFGWIYKRRIENFDSMTDISREARTFLKNNFFISQLGLAKRETSCDSTEKFLFALEDKNYIETVLIPEGKRSTLCLSSQVGCKFGCKFCLSGKDGFKRNLEVSEIVNQYLIVSDLIAPHRITNIVFMGIGEPLDNFLNTTKAVKLFLESKGICFGRRRICISTCGLIPQIKKLADLHLGVKLSISLHSASNGFRTQIMPINRKHPLEELIKAVKSFSKKEKYPVTFEYVLIKGLNTSKDDAHQLAELLKGINYKINLIPLNYFSCRFNSPDQREIASFKEELKKKGVFFTSRESRGRDIRAACGQLKSLYSR